MDGKIPITDSTPIMKKNIFELLLSSLVPFGLAMFMLLLSKQQDLENFYGYVTASYEYELLPLQIGLAGLM